LGPGKAGSRRRQEISLDAFLGIAALNPGYGASGAGVNVLVSLWWKAEASPTLQMP